MVKALTDSSSSTVKVNFQSGRSLLLGYLLADGVHVVLDRLVLIEAIGAHDLLVEAAGLLDLALLRGRARRSCRPLQDWWRNCRAERRTSERGRRLRDHDVTPAGAGSPEGELRKSLYRMERAGREVPADFATPKS